MNKKAISPVVATALLLVVAVVAVVGFQTWFVNYQSGVNTQVEQRSQTGSALTVERLEATNSGSNATIYVKNAATSAVTISEFKVTSSGSIICSNSTGGSSTASTVTSFVITDSSCSLTSGQAYDIVLVTADGVFSSTQIAR